MTRLTGGHGWGGVTAAKVMHRATHPSTMATPEPDGDLDDARAVIALLKEHAEELRRKGVCRRDDCWDVRHLVPGNEFRGGRKRKTAVMVGTLDLVQPSRRPLPDEARTQVRPQLPSPTRGRPPPNRT